MLIEFHRRMLADEVRSAAFHEALRRVIVPGHSTVADLGAGTGILGLVAHQLGAREVHLVEHGDVLAVAERVAARNGLDGLHFWNCHSAEIADPPRVDVVVAEVLGNLAFEEGVIETLADASRFLKPGGTLIPSAIAQWVAPVVSAQFHAELRSWDRVGFGLDFSDARALSFDNVYVRRFAAADLLPGASAARCIDEARFGPELAGSRAGSVRWQLDESTTVFGFALWWQAELVPGVELTTSPHAPATHWDQVYVPVLEPVAGRAGDELALDLQSETGGGDGIGLRWEVTHRRGDTVIARESHDIVSGYIG